jgi:penicillin-binding protein 1C
MKLPEIKIPGFKYSGIIRSLISIVVIILLTFLILDLVYPIDLNPKTKTRIILSSDGTPLRAFPDKNGVWRYPITMDQVSKHYVEALIGYEDRWFYHHPGINPLSLLRASFQWFTNKRVVSGGSTLTMQVARLKRPLPRSVAGKIGQIFTALQLELHFNKREILNYYLNHAPFGGTFEGVQAASYAYFDHNAKDLTRAQAALLAVMPQAPSRYRPDRYPEAAQKARNKLLDRLIKFNIWTKKDVDEAKEERVTSWPVETKIYAPLLARRLHQSLPASKIRIKTFIDYRLQLSAEQQAEDYTSNLPPHLSVSILVMDNKTGGILAYVGSSNLFNLSRFGHVDMVKAMRSPGSTMKPFIYGLALDKGLIHSQSLLMDIPIHFSDYRPVNFHRSFSGPVSVAKALSLSLNLPAVQVLDHIEPRYFYAQMINSGFKIKLPRRAKPNLSMALGGFSTNLENLVLAYSSLGRGGETIQPRFLKESKIVSQPLTSKGAAWIVQEMLLTEKDTNILATNRKFAIKTGTSYGFRDAWALGVNKRYTIGVWVGRPDGIPVPGHYGSQTATPLLKRVFQLLPKHKYRIKRPDSVTGAKICWPDGLAALYNKAKNRYSCESPRNAWVLDRTTPKTLSSKKDSTGRFVRELSLTLSHDGKYRIPFGCDTNLKKIQKKIKLWPKSLESWLPKTMQRKNLIPGVLPKCRKIGGILIEEYISIQGLSNNDMIIRKDKTTKYPIFNLFIQGGNGPWYWLENSKMVKDGSEYIFAPKHPGKYQLLVVDQSGMMDQISVEVF